MKSFRLAQFLLLVVGTLSAAQAQTMEALPYVDTEPARRTVVKFAPLSLFDPDNTVQFGLERLFDQHNAVQLELGYGWQDLNVWQSTQNQRYSGREIWRARTEWRYYLHKTNQPQGQYVALEGFYKQVNVHESGTIGVGCNTGPCQYYQLFTSPLQKYVWGGHAKFGYQFAFAPDNNRLLVDIYAGLGFRRRTVERFQQSTDSYYYYSTGYKLFDSFSATPYTLISVSYGVKVGYSF